MDQINIQSFCQVESELFHDFRFDLRRVFRKSMPIGAHQFPTLRPVESTSENQCRSEVTQFPTLSDQCRSELINFPHSARRNICGRVNKIERTPHVVNRSIPAKASSYPGWSERAFPWRPLSMANQSNRKYPCGP